MTTLRDSQLQPILDSQGTAVTTDYPYAAEFHKEGVIPLNPDPKDPALKTYLQSLDVNGDGKLGMQEMETFLRRDVIAAFEARSQTSPRVKLGCSLASGVAVDGQLPDEWIARVETDSKTRIHKLVDDYFNNDAAREVFKGGVYSVTDADIAPVIQFNVDFAKSCARGK